MVGFDNKIHFLGNDKKLLIELGDISKKAGINSKYKVLQTRLNSIVILKKYLLDSYVSSLKRIITKFHIKQCNIVDYKELLGTQNSVVLDNCVVLF